MIKKFSFNFKFLDRFKKKKADDSISSDEYTTDNQENQSEYDDEDGPITFAEMKKPGAEVEESFEEIENVEIAPTRTPQFQTLPTSDDTEFESAESSEEFAEKTLGGYKLPPKDENNNFANFQIENTEENSSFDQLETHHEEFSNDLLPPKPEEAKKFKFNFPKFNRESFGKIKTNSFDFRNRFQKIEKLNWTEAIQKIFSPYSRPKIHTGFTIIAIICFTYLLGKSFALFTSRMTKIEVKPKSSINVPSAGQDTTVMDIGKISSTNLFNAKETEEMKKAGPKINIEQIVCLDADRPTTSQMKLLDTIVLQDSVKSVASVQVRGEENLLNIREGEKVENYEISRIKRMKLILKNLETGDCEYIASDKEDENNSPSPITVLPASKAKSIFKSMNPNIKNDGNTFKIKKNYRDQMVTKMNDILTQARAIQITNPDGTMCFKMTEVVAGSVYTQLNIQENDIVCSINGRKIDNLNELMGLLGRIKDIDSMQIGLKRNGMQENLEYSFE